MTKENHSNRGMDLERLIEKQCEIYEKQNIAFIKKMPTDWQVLRRGKNIVSAFPKKKSIFDFIGVWNGKAIGIEAKRTNNNTSFPFQNIHEHQWDFFDKWCSVNGLGYFIIWFKELDKMFLIDAIQLKQCKDTIGRKSAPISWFEENATHMKSLDFLKNIS